MQLGRAPLNACRPLARLGSFTRRICVIRATGTKSGSSNPVTQSLLDFFDDITEGARDGARRRAAQEHDVPDVTDITSKVQHAADAVEAAAADLHGMLGDASTAMKEAFGGLDGRVAGLKQQLLKGEKDIEAVVDEVVHVIGNDARKIASALAGGDKQAADAAHAALDAAVAKAQKLRSDAKQGLVTAEHAAEEVIGIARSMLQEVQHLLTPKAAKTAGRTPGQTAGQTAGQRAMAAITSMAGTAAKAAEKVKGDAAKPAATTSTAAPAKQAAAHSGGAAASAATAATDAAAAALEATAAAAAVIAEKGLAMADKAAATDVEALAVALEAQVTSLRAKAGQLQVQAASGSTNTSEAVKALLGQFSDAISAIEMNVAAGAAPGGSSAAGGASLQAALQRSRKDAGTGARMVAEAAARQDISSERAVQYLSSLLRQLAADVSSELTQQGKQQQKSTAAASGSAHTSASGFAAGRFGCAADTSAGTAAGLQDSEIVVASVDELELVLQDASSQSQVVRAAAKGFAAAEAAAASLQQRLPEFKQALAATTAGGNTEAARQAAARILIGAAGEVEGQLAELQGEMLAQAGGGEAGAAAAASLQLLRASVEARVQELAGKVEAGQVKPAAALDELLLGLQSSISGELRSCLLDSLSQSSAPGSASISMSEEEIAAQLATAIADARKERAAAANEGLEEAIAAGKFAAWVIKAAVGVGALQLVKSGAGMALEKVGVALPGALGGMLGVAALLAMIGEAGAEPLVKFYDSYISWTTGMLSLFYVPTLAVVPTLLQGTDISGLMAASLAGTAASLVFAAAVASLLTPKPEAASDTLLATATPTAKASSQQTALLAVAAFAAVAPLVLTKVDPTAFGQLMTVPVGLAWSLFGVLAGKGMGVNPMLLGAAAANAGVFWHGKLMGWGYSAAIDAFFGQGAGAGELLTAVLGMALTGLGFVVYKQRRNISFAAVAVTAVAAAAFNVMSTIGATHLVPLTDVWCKAFVTRGIPSSLAPAVASSIGATPELAAIAVLLQAAITVVLGSTLLKLLAGNKEAAAGIAAGCTAGGIGAAAVSAGKPAALANGVLAYAALHVLSAAMLGVPAVGEALQAAVAVAAS